MADRPGPRVPPPPDLAALPAERMHVLERHLPEPDIAAACVDLLSGADPRAHLAVFPYLAGRASVPGVLERWPSYWWRVWGARGLLYGWDESAESAVVAGLADPAWRVAEMCLKVSAKHRVAGSGDGAAVLAAHDLSRVRAAALRTLRQVGDTEHVAVVRSALDDDDEQVRRTAGSALETMTRRLDLPT